MSLTPKQSQTNWVKMTGGFWAAVSAPSAYISLFHASSSNPSMVHPSYGYSLVAPAYYYHGALHPNSTGYMSQSLYKLRLSPYGGCVSMCEGLEAPIHGYEGGVIAGPGLTLENHGPSMQPLETTGVAMRIFVSPEEHAFEQVSVDIGPAQYCQ